MDRSFSILWKFKDVYLMHMYYEQSQKLCHRNILKQAVKLKVKSSNASNAQKKSVFNLIPFVFAQLFNLVLKPVIANNLVIPSSWSRVLQSFVDKSVDIGQYLFLFCVISPLYELSQSALQHIRTPTDMFKPEPTELPGKYSRLLPVSAKRGAMQYFRESWTTIFLQVNGTFIFASNVNRK